MKKPTTKEKILQAATELFSYKGYTSATTREVAKEAGVCELTVFRYFLTKEKLFTEILESYLKPPYAEEMYKQTDGLSKREIISGLWSRLFKHFQSSKKIQTIVLSQSYKNKEVAQMSKCYFTDIETLLTDCIKKTGILEHTEAVNFAAATLHGAYAFFVLEEIIKGRSVDDTEIKQNGKLFADIINV
ncbi:MAG: TetR/AcrR family transcriptional regulator [Nitrospirae bacterium YQR-1]